MTPKKKRLSELKPLTKRQVEVLAGVAFGEVYVSYVNYAKFGCEVLKTFFFEVDHTTDVSSVIAKLKKRKLIKLVQMLHMGEQGNQVYLVLTDNGYLELAKYPEQWNV
jgi:hypothetical protein